MNLIQKYSTWSSKGNKRNTVQFWARLPETSIPRTTDTFVLVWSAMGASTVRKLIRWKTVYYPNQSLRPMEKCTTLAFTARENTLHQEQDLLLSWRNTRQQLHSSKTHMRNLLHEYAARSNNYTGCLIFGKPYGRVIFKRVSRLLQKGFYSTT